MRTITDLVASHAPRLEMLARLAELSAAPRVECFYYGCFVRSGHYLWQRDGQSVDYVPRNQEREITALLGGLDTDLCWNGRKSSGRDETEGRAFVTRCGGYTALAFWDRSVDDRPGCNSVFVAPGELSFGQMMRLARQQWPMIWRRFRFEVVEVDERGRVKT